MHWSRKEGEWTKEGKCMRGWEMHVGGSRRDVYFAEYV